MKKTDSLIGSKYGRLEILAHDESGTTKHPRQICRCDCGKIKSIIRYEITSGRTQSCGCYRLEKIASKDPWGVEWRRYKVHHYRHFVNRKRKQERQKNKFVFSLSKKQFEFFCSNNCEYCGSEPSIKMHVGGKMRNTLDRIKPDGGYTPSNVSTACLNCNFSRRRLTRDQFIENCYKVVNFQEKKNGK